MTDHPLAIKSPILENLMEELRDFVADALKHYRLDVKQTGWENQPHKRDAEVYQMTPPDADEDHERIPYVLLQLLNGSDKRDGGGKMVSKAEVRMVIVLYNEDKLEGRLQVIRVVEKIRYELWRAGIIGKRFQLDGLEWLIYPDETTWYYMGEISTEWVIPSIERDLTALMRKGI